LPAEAITAFVETEDWQLGEIQIHSTVGRATPLKDGHGISMM
jgi:hypothetical protein